MLLNKREIKIFLTFFIIYSLFVHWIGWDEQSQFILTRAIVDEGRFEIDSYANQTADRSFYNDHYYSDKDPGPSFLAVPIYGTWKLIYNNFFPNDFQEKYSGGKDFITSKAGTNNVTIIDYIDPGYFILTSMILVTIFTSSLFSALLIVLIYEISKYFTKNEKYRLLLVFTAGLGTLIFPYALVFMKHATETFFCFLAFYILFRAKQDKLKESKYFVLSGLSLGIAITSSITSVIVGIACLIYVISFRKEKIFHFILGIFIGILPFLIYNYIVFGNPFTLSRFYMDPKIWTEIGGIEGLKLPNLFIAIRLMFDTYKGIFFYYPILLFSFLGLKYMYKKFKVESLLIIFIFLTFLILNSSWWAWWGGTSFGPRHLLPSVPFLVLPLLFLFEKFEHSKTLKIIAFILIFYSIFVNFSGLQSLRGDNAEILDMKTLTIKQEYVGKINSFQILFNPLYDYYTPLFLKNGPRSRIFEHITNGEFVIDIRDVNLSKNVYFPFTSFYVPFLVLVPLFSILIIIWNKEILSYRKELSLIIISIVLFILLIYITRPNDVLVFSTGWYPKLSYEDEIWMFQNGTILIFNNQSEKIMLFNSLIRSYSIDRKINLYFNGKLLDNFIAYEDKDLNYSWLLKLQPNENTIIFSSERECFIPNLKDRTQEDYRCLSIRLKKVNLSDFSSENIVFNKNWYGKSGEDWNWMNNNGTLIFNNLNSSSITKKLSFYLISFYRKRQVQIFLNKLEIDSFLIETNSTLKKEIYLILKPGLNTIEFYSKEDCDVVNEVTNSTDARCLSLGIADLKI